MRDALRDIADSQGLWAGLPMPLNGKRLTVEPRFPHAEALRDLGVTTQQRQDEQQKEDDFRAKYGDIKMRSQFWSFNRKAWVITYEDTDGKVRHCLDHAYHRSMRLFDTLECSSAWGLEQESRAVHLLGKLLRHHHFKSYLLTGMFMEKSERTGLIYIFRRLRPTVVLDLNNPDGEVRIRCALCMHPVGYYEGTWCGVMTPTDEVVAHLTMMRGDEPMYWRRANQHPAWSPLAGI